MISRNHASAAQRPLDSDLCIVGGGPAAISLALALGESGRTVILIVGGGWAQTNANRDLNRGAHLTNGSHEPLEQNRRRQYGGASAVWGGRCVPFDPIDFEPRGWVPDSGWPIAFETLRPYYRRAAELCQVGIPEFDAHRAFPARRREIISGLDSAQVVSYPLERWSPPINFAAAYGPRLARNPNVRVLLDAHALRMVPAPSGKSIASVSAVMGGKGLVIRAHRFVLAAGGIENPRLLLNSASHLFPSGVGNRNDNVGRYYMSHLSGNYAQILPRFPRQLLADFERDANGVYCRRRWWIAEEAQRAERLLNTVFFLTYSNGEAGQRDPGHASRVAAKSLQAILQPGAPRQIWKRAREFGPGLAKASYNLMRYGLPHVPALLDRGVRRLARRRLPVMLPMNGSSQWGLYFQAEHAPHRESRLTLSPTELDGLGVPRLDVQIGFDPLDVESVVRAHEIFVANYRRRNVGTVLYTESGLREYLARQIESFNSAAHHIGTTRMSDDPRTGVVDRNAQVHGVDNLFVAGSSVFPTGGHANPTFTLLAQTLRLADHLIGAPAAV
jgi:choline dehydrogenase-like flavoprotein